MLRSAVDLLGKQWSRVLTKNNSKYTRTLTSTHTLTRACKSYASTTTSSQADSVTTASSSKEAPALDIHLGQPASWTHAHLVNTNELTPMVTFDEYKHRRRALMDSLPANSCVILPGHATSLMSADIPYPFRQNNDMAYVSGFEEPDSVCIIRTKGNAFSSADDEESLKMALVVPPKDAHSEKWNGARTGTSFAKAHFGADDAYTPPQLVNALDDYLKDVEHIFYEHRTPVHTLFNKTIQTYLAEHKHRIPLVSPTKIVQQLRLYKSESEYRIMKRCGDISSRAFVQTMKATKPGVSEHILDAVMDFECRKEGCKRLAYPPVVAGGNRANTLHYVNNNNIVEDGDLVLIDAGGELYNYAADITRTYPANGKFSPAQKKVYNAVLRTLEDLTSLCRPSQKLSLNVLHEQSRRLLFDELVQLGIITGGQSQSNLKLLNRWYPHHIGHYVGMDVHDLGLISRSETLKEGMVICLEPGLYFAKDDIDVPEEFRGIGIRIEDDLIITSDGYEVLSSGCPKSVDQIEALMSA
ncbi:hypothetical protein SARC_02832 [Sphaeroforma arctica JP610]|uniref:Aminopeptidase P N-terminal domain-containing protein n=1 Tax=Sphaeroforma arctica JP610 TaxID=667725 RepID=A0A0L0G7G3_9EUKA|nr:hypothetical protein SARC_02832 [Sphaeroforma arctica JP610]KNC84977.1 hypothetical protein SARC_02832 [Sphaeroforma arctica JP610]|eukprot:XP_014158879.1 hypothetical protein SARC_02832 [Sphaeroforma arctica JP610]